MAKNILTWSEAAKQFYREIGKKPNGKAIRFYLGDDEKKATANVLRLEALWDGVETRWSELASGNVADSEFPRWDDVTVALGRAIATVASRSRRSAASTGARSRMGTSRG